MIVTRDLVKKIECGTTDEVVQAMLQYVLDNEDIDKKTLLLFMRDSVEKFFRANGEKR